LVDTGPREGKKIFIFSLKNANLVINNIDVFYRLYHDLEILHNAHREIGYNKVNAIVSRIMD
jgi:hypothetical protein